MILGYKANYDRRMWLKTLASISITLIFFGIFVSLFLNFVLVYIEWLNYFFDLMHNNSGLPPSVISELDKITDPFDAMYLITINALVLIVMLVGGLYFVARLGINYSLTISNWINKKLNLISMMRLSFKKVNPSRLDPIIKWLNN